ncbi:MAG TPA: deoxyribose-phosphate aldolase [Geminicoccaceae bacterium]|nr:deoxyribose-phosphate aldolase [Geminicoccaceae bacterium]
MPEAAADLIARAQTAPVDATLAARALPLLDLTSLNDADTDADIERLCRRAAEYGTAAVCIWPRFVPLAKGLLRGSGVRLATVANFPHGGDDIAGAAKECAAAVAAGADEVDVVAPIAAIRGGDIGMVSELVTACRTAAAETTLKVILETGVLGDPSLIAGAARAAVMAGGDFLKTSTGKAAVGATLEAAAVLLAVIEEADGKVGFKAAGGIRTAQQAASYLFLAEQLIDPSWACPRTFRFGASALLDDLLRALPPGSAEGDA